MTDRRGRGRRAAAGSRLGARVRSAQIRGALTLSTVLAAAVVLVACSSATSPTASPASSSSPSPSLTPRCGNTIAYDPPPPPGTPFQIELDGGAPDDPGARIVEVDGETPEDLLRMLHEEGAYVLCYFSAGTVEDYRLDAMDFPENVIGNALPDWPDERYLDIRDLDTLEPLWAARLDNASAGGCDAVDPDNIDSYTNDSGFPLTADDAVAAMEWLAGAAHSRGMAIGQKNAPELTPRLVGLLDLAVTEECLTQGWCDQMTPYVDAGKPVLAIEYVEEGATLDSLCPAAEAARLSLLVTTLDLPGTGQRCPAA